jgi:hypothetical protein
MSEPSPKRLTPPMGRNWPWVLLLLVGMASWLAALLHGQPVRAWQGLLVNFLYFSPLAAGMVVWPGIVAMSRGTWARKYSPVALSGQGFMPLGLILLLALWFTQADWGPWAGAGSGHGWWLEPKWLFGRDVAALTLLWLVSGIFLRRRVRGKSPRGAGAMAVLYAAAFTLVGFDLVMSLDAKWYSTLFGGYFLISGLYAGMAAWTLLSLPRLDEIRRRRDMANLVLAFSLLTTYMMFSQLLPIWYENLPQEARFVAPRLNVSPTDLLSLGLLASAYLGPLVLLLFRAIKTSRTGLTCVMLYVLVGAWAERWWLVMPTLGHQHLDWPELAAGAMCLGGFALTVNRFSTRMPDELPEEVLSP